MLPSSRARPSRAHLAVLALAVASAVGARVVAHLALDDLAHVMDEIAYLFQAKVFAAGELRAPEALPRAAFTMWFLEDRGARYGVFPPGWPALLALGVRLGVTWWMNPLLHLATVVMVGRAGERLGGEQAGLVAAALYATSPQAVLLAASLMSHTAVACAASVVILFAAVLLGGTRLADVRGGGADARRWALAAGLAIGVAAATRPLCGAVLFGFAALALAAAARHEALPRRRLAAVVALLALGAAPAVLALFAYNRALTGSPTRFPQMAYFDEHLPPADVPFFRYRPGCNTLGFGPGHGCDLTVRDAHYTLGTALSNLGDNLFAWLLLACGPLLVVGAGLAVAKREVRARSLLLLSMPALAVLAYALYWHGGTSYGARFYQSALPALMVVVALGATAAASARSRARVLGALLAATLSWNVFAYHRAWRELAHPAWGYWGVDDRYAALARTWKSGPAIVMVAFGPDDLANPRLGWTAVLPEGGIWMPSIRALAALAENPADLADAGDVLFAKFHPALAPELRARFPGRSLWLYVAHPDRMRDRVEPYDPAPFAARADEPPPDNFDGFRVAKPRSPQEPMMTPSRPYWP